MSQLSTFLPAQDPSLSSSSLPSHLPLSTYLRTSSEHRRPTSSSVEVAARGDFDNPDGVRLRTQPPRSAKQKQKFRQQPVSSKASDSTRRPIQRTDSSNPNTSRTVATSAGKARTSSKGKQRATAPVDELAPESSEVSLELCQIYPIYQSLGTCRMTIDRTQRYFLVAQSTCSTFSAQSLFHAQHRQRT